MAPLCTVPAENTRKPLDREHSVEMGETYSAVNKYVNTYKVDQLFLGHNTKLRKTYDQINNL